jgi:hypothetical protein
MKMLSLDDPKWKSLQGGYKIDYDPTPALRRLESGDDVWDELWDELHHQGDLGEASYAAVPHLVRIGKSLPSRNWNLYGLVSTIEIERHRKSNPPLPDWTKESYHAAWHNLLEVALVDLKKTNDAETIRSILGVIALAKGELELGALIAHSDLSEITEILEDRAAWSELYVHAPPSP